jgi:hypothetical protein
MGVHVIPNRDSDGRVININDPFASKAGHLFDGQGFHGTAVKNTSSEISHTITAVSDMSGVEILNGVVGDQIQMQVRDDASGTYSGTPNAVLDQFGTNWNIRPNFVKLMPYTARVYPNMKVVFIYENNDVNNDREIYINLDLHKVV